MACRKRKRLQRLSDKNKQKPDKGEGVKKESLWNVANVIEETAEASRD